MDIEWPKKLVLIFIACISFVLVTIPMIRSLAGTKTIPYQNYVSKNEFITMRLLYSENRNLENETVLWENTKVKFSPQKFVFRDKINLTIETDKILKQTTGYLALQAIQNGERNGTFLNSYKSKPILFWIERTKLQPQYLLDKNYSKQDDVGQIQVVPITYKTFRFDLVDFGEVVYRESLHKFIQKRVFLNETDRKYFPVVRYDDFFDTYRQRKVVEIGKNHTEISVNVEFNIRNYLSWSVKESIPSIIRHAKKYSTKYPILLYIITFFDEMFEQIRMVFLDNPDLQILILIILIALNYLLKYLTFKVHKNYKYVYTEPNNSILQAVNNLFILTGMMTYSVFPNIHLGLRCSMIYKFTKILINTITFLVRRKNLMSKSQSKTFDEIISQQKMYEDYFYKVGTLVSYFFALLLWMQQLYFEKYWGYKFYIMYSAFTSSYIVNFPNMLKSLYANYKLKSVPPMSIWLVLYKLVSAIIDEYINFSKHLSTTMKIQAFRDDVAVIILLIQMIIYKVDARRPNEFGQMLIEKEKKEDKKEKVKEEEEIVINENRNMKENADLSDGVRHRKE